MPQLKKVVLAVGNRLVYADTYEQALAQLTGGAQQLIAEATTPGAKPAPGSPAPTGDARLQQVREHLRRYRELASQGKWSEAGRELEAIEAAVKQ
jgi:uncharacterized membrane protein (UPF0182 family)